MYFWTTKELDLMEKCVVDSLMRKDFFNTVSEACLLPDCGGAYPVIYLFMSDSNSWREEKTCTPLP